jgi:hypothetical protein
MPSTWTTSRSQRSPSQWSSLTTPRSSLPTSLTYAYPASRRQHDGCTYAETRTYPWPYSPSARNHKTGLYMVNPPSDPTGSTLVANMVIKSQTQADQVRFGVATMAYCHLAQGQYKTVPHRHSGDDTKLIITQASTGQNCRSQRPSAPRYDSAVKGPDCLRWEAGQNTEWDRLVDTGCIVFQPAGALPPGCKAFYHKPQPELKVRASGDVEYRIRSTYGGDRGDYSGPTKAETADMATL